MIFYRLNKKECEMLTCTELVVWMTFFTKMFLQLQSIIKAKKEVRDIFIMNQLNHNLYM